MVEESKRRKNKEVVGGTQKSPSEQGEHSQNANARHDPELLLRLLVESVVDYAIFLLDPEGHVLTWNRGAQRIKGYSSREIIGHHFSSFYTPEDIARNHPQEVLEAALRHGRYE